MSKPFIYKGQAIWFTLAALVENGVPPRGAKRLCEVCHQTKAVAGRYTSEQAPGIIVCSKCGQGGEAPAREIRVEVSPKPGLAVVAGARKG